MLVKQINNIMYMPSIVFVICLARSMVCMDMYLTSTNTTAYLLQRCCVNHEAKIKVRMVRHA